MKRGKIVLLLILIALAVLAAWLLLSKKRQETIKPVFTADSTMVSRIEIADAKLKMVLAKVNDHWSIIEPIKWEVEKDHFRGFFHDVILQTYGATPLSRGKEALNQYRLEGSTAVKVKVFDTKGKLIREAWYSDLNNSMDYFRFAGDDRVYQTRQKSKSLYRPDMDKWRSPYVLSLSTEQMRSIKVTHPKNSYELTSRDSFWHFRDKNEEFDIPAGNVTTGKIFNIIARLGSYSVLSGKDLPTKASLSATLCEVTIQTKRNKTYDLKFYRYKEQYLMIDASHPELNFIVPFDTVFRFTRHAALFRAREGYPDL